MVQSERLPLASIQYRRVDKLRELPWEPRTMWKASITSDGDLWPECLWISVSQETGYRLDDGEEFEFWGEIRNNPVTVPSMKFGKTYKFHSELNGIFSVFPIEEKRS